MQNSPPSTPMTGWRGYIRAGSVPSWQAYLFAVFVSVATLVARIALEAPLGGIEGLLIFTVPIMLSAFVGGLRAGLLSTGLSIAGASYLLWEPLRGFSITSVAERWEVASLALVGVLISVLNESFHQARRVADNAVRDLRDAEAALRLGETQQLELVEQLKVRHERLVAAQAVSKVGSWTTELATLAVDWSDETHRLFGTDPATYQPTHESFLERVHPDDRAAVSEAFTASLGARVESRIEHRIITVDHCVKTVEERWRWITDDEGKVTKAIGTCQDVTERNEAEAVRARSAAILESVGQAVIATDPKGIITYANRVAGELYGWRVEDVLGKDILDVTVPNTSHEQAAQIIAQLSRGEKWSGEFDVQRSDGTIFPALVTNATQTDASGQLIGFIGISKDISARREAEATFQRAAQQTARRERFLNTTLSSINDFAYAYDRDGRFLFVNQPLLDWWGMRLEDALGKNFHDLGYPPELAGRLEQEIAQVFETRKDVPGETSYRNPAGVEGFYEYIFSPALADDGSVDFVVGTTRDVTERKRVEEELKQTADQFRRLSDKLAHANEELSESEHKFRQLADNVSDVFFIQSPDLKTVHYVSPAYEVVWGRSVKALYANAPEWSDAIVSTDRERVLETLSRLGPAQPSITMEFRISRPDGTKRWVQSNAVEVRAESGEVLSIVGTARDITVRKDHESQLDKSHRQLLEASRKAGMAEVATNVLHNVGNVLNSVNVSASLALDSVKSSRAAQMAQVVALMAAHKSDLGNYLTIDPAGRHIPTFLEDVSREWSMQQGALVLELGSLRENVDHIKQIVAMQQGYARIVGLNEITEVSELMEDALRVQEGSMDQHRIRIVREFAEVPPINVAKHKVLPILVNLMRNAKHACHAMADTDRRVVLRIARAGDRVRMSVIDDGEGIAPEHITRIFSHGFTTRKDGHGFGLHSGALSAAELGGSLTVHSEGAGKGATFTLELPMQPAEETL